MPDTLKYYPVLARLLLLLEGNPIITYRAAIVTRQQPFIIDYRMVYRFVTEYKGGEYGGAEQYHELHRSQAMRYLEKLIYKAEWYDKKALEPMVEVEINLRGVKAVKVPKTIG